MHRAADRKPRTARAFARHRQDGVLEPRKAHATALGTNSPITAEAYHPVTPRLRASVGPESRFGLARDALAHPRAPHHRLDAATSEHDRCRRYSLSAGDGSSSSRPTEPERCTPTRVRAASGSHRHRRTSTRRSPRRCSRTRRRSSRDARSGAGSTRSSARVNARGCRVRHARSSGSSRRPDSPRRAAHTSTGPDHGAACRVRAAAFPATGTPRRGARVRHRAADAGGAGRDVPVRPSAERNAGGPKAASQARGRARDARGTDSPSCATRARELPSPQTPTRRRAAPWRGGPSRRARSRRAPCRCRSRD